MFPTHEDGESLLILDGVYRSSPSRGDIIVFRDPRDISDDLIKRVIGLPGDTIEIRNGVVSINDLQLDEPYITTACTSSCDKSKILIPENEYFVMGDNRNNSHDSRFQDIGLVHRDLVIGRAWVTFWPSGQGLVGLLFLAAVFTVALILTIVSVVFGVRVARYRGRSWAWGLLGFLIGGFAPAALALVPQRRPRPD